MKQSQLQVAELSSPPRFSLEVETHGGKGLACDIKQGWDLSGPRTQGQVDRLLVKARPELLIACPTCVQHIRGDGRISTSVIEHPWKEPSWSGEIVPASVQFCVKQTHKQVQRGGAFMLEHPWPSSIWKSPELRSRKGSYGAFR